MNRLLKLFLVSLLLFLFNYSEAQFRKYSNEFLNIGAGARGLGMGGAQVASVMDGTAGYWNPAGLAHLKDNAQVNLMHSEYFAGIGKYDYLNASLPTKDQKRTIAITALRFAVDDIPNTLFLVEPDGSYNYDRITTFSSADYAFLVSYAQRVKQTQNSSINFGVNAKVIYRNVGSFANAWGFGLDAGLQIIKEQWQFGIVAKDVTTTFNTWSFHWTEAEKERLYATNNKIPTKGTEMTSPRLTVGAARSFRLGKSSALLAEANLDVTFDGKRNTVVSADPVSIDPKIGLEYAYKDIFYVRGGINNFQKALADGDTLNKKTTWIYQPSAGAGFKIKPVTVDYAFVNLANQSNPLFTHVISLKIDIARRKK